MMKGIFAVYKRELNSYFYSSIAYVFLILFILIPNILFFYFMGGIFKEGIATMRNYFILLPYIFIIFIPGLTMGSWAKEKNSGTIELLFTLPVNQFEVLLGKFLSALTLVLIALFCSLFIPLLTNNFAIKFNKGMEFTIWAGLGEFDWGQIFTQYFGAILLACCYIAITFFLSSLTMELINSFLLSATILLVLTIIGFLSITINFIDQLSWLKIVFKEISLSTHFTNFSKGVIDSRDLFYYIGVTAIFFYLNLHSLQTRKWS